MWAWMADEESASPACRSRQTLGDILQQPKPVAATAKAVEAPHAPTEAAPHEDDAAQLPIASAPSSVLCDPVCDGGTVLSARRAAELADASGTESAGAVEVPQTLLETCGEGVVAQEQLLLQPSEEVKDDPSCGIVDQKIRVYQPKALEKETGVFDVPPATTTQPCAQEDKDQHASCVNAEMQEFEDQMADFEREYARMQIETSGGVPQQHAVHVAYGELYNAVPMDMVFRMKAAMKEVPEVRCNVEYNTTIQASLQDSISDACEL